MSIVLRKPFRPCVIRVTPLSPGAGPYRVEVNGKVSGPALATYLQAERIALWLEHAWEELP